MRLSFINIAAALVAGFVALGGAVAAERPLTLAFIPQENPEKLIGFRLRFAAIWRANWAGRSGGSSRRTTPPPSRR